MDEQHAIRLTIKRLIVVASKDLYWDERPLAEPLQCWGAIDSLGSFYMYRDLVRIAGLIEDRAPIQEVRAHVQATLDMLAACLEVE